MLFRSAELLGISAQTVSRWECGTTLPDVLLLPEIARLYCVTIDDLYKEKSVAYANYAQRLASVYEASDDPADFHLVDMEYKKMQKEGPLSAEDLRTYGVVHHFMMQYCIEKALQLFDEVLARKADDRTYWKTRYQKQGLLSQIGKSKEVIAEQEKQVEQHPEISREWAMLIHAYMTAGEYEKAYEIFHVAVKKFPNDWDIILHGGDCCRQLKKYEEAFFYWDKALEIDPDFYDAKYSKAFTYEELGEYEKAYVMWCDINENLKKDGMVVEAESNWDYAEKCREKMQKKHS